MLAFDPVRVAHQHVRPPTSTAQRSFAHGDVITNQVELRVLRLREQHFVRIGDRDLMPGNGQGFGGALLGHADGTMAASDGSLSIGDIRRLFHEVDHFVSNGRGRGQEHRRNDSAVDDYIADILIEGETIALSLPLRGDISVRVEEAINNAVTLVTVDGHPLAGFVRFTWIPTNDGFRFEVNVYDRPATLIDNKGGQPAIGNSTWLGYQDDSVDVVLTLQKASKVKKVLVDLLEDHGSWVFLPEKIEVFYLVPGTGERRSFGKLLTSAEKVLPGARCEYRIIEADQPIITNNLIVRLSVLKSMPATHPGSGMKSWIFIDEIKVY